MKIFTIRDGKAESYLQPFYSQNHATAMRALTSALENKDHDFAKFTEDYSLFYIGEYDEMTGKIAPVDPEHILNLIDLKGTLNG